MDTLSTSRPQLSHPEDVHERIQSRILNTITTLCQINPLSIGAIIHLATHEHVAFQFEMIISDLCSWPNQLRGTTSASPSFNGHRPPAEHPLHLGGSHFQQLSSFDLHQLHLKHKYRTSRNHITLPPSAIGKMWRDVQFPLVALDHHF